jgi:hypothetical protein
MLALRPALAIVALLVALLVALAAPAAEEDARPLTAEEVKAAWHGRLDNRHFSARVRLSMDRAGLHEEREMLVWRDDAGGTTERVMIRFEAPPDLRNVGLLYLEHEQRPNDYFLYQPATRRVRRLPETIANEDVYGIDLEFLGFGVAQSEPTEVESLARVPLPSSEDGAGNPSGNRTGNRKVYRLTERALRPNPRFEQRVTWLDPESFVPLRTEHIRAGRTRLLAETLETRVIQSVETPVRMRFRNADGSRRVDLRVESVDYESDVPEEYFSTFALLRAQISGSVPPAN